jgi:hypothetical protein
MQRLTIRYLLIVTAVIAVSIVVIRSPGPPAKEVPFDASQGTAFVMEDQPSTVGYFLALWPVQFLAYVGGVTLSLHTFSVAIGLKGIARWLLPVTVPVVANVGWHWYSVNRLGYHPGSLSVWGHAQIGFLVNSLSCISLAAILAILHLRRGSAWTKQD